MKDLISKKGVFIPDITVEIFRNASLESLEELMVSGEMKDIVLPSAQQWIPCSDRLPFAEYGESDSVIVQFENGSMDVLYYNGGNWCYPTGETYISTNHGNGWHNYVIAWMPCPDPYKESEE